MGLQGFKVLGINWVGWGLEVLLQENLEFNTEKPNHQTRNIQNSLQSESKSPEAFEPQDPEAVCQASQSPVDALPASPTGHHDAMGGKPQRLLVLLSVGFGA